MAHQRILRPHYLSKHLIQRIAPAIAVAITGGGRKMRFADLMIDKSAQHLLLVVFGHLVDGCKARRDLGKRLIRQLFQPFIYCKKRGFQHPSSFRILVAHSPAGTNPQRVYSAAAWAFFGDSHTAFPCCCNAAASVITVQWA